MDYEKILKRIVQIINTTENSDIGFTNICTYIGENCPELQKSEDERIRKELIDYINRLTVTPNNIDRYNAWITWLEKQGETNKTINRDEFAQGVLRGTAINLITWIDYNAAEGNMCLSNTECKDIEDALVSGNWNKIYAYMKKKLEKQDEKKHIFDFNANNWYVSKVDGKIHNIYNSGVEPKFHEGDWVVWQDKCYKVNYNGCRYELIDQNGLSTSLEHGTIDESAHLWNISDAKNGDVLLFEGYYNSIVLFQGIGINGKGRINYHCKCDLGDYSFGIQGDVACLGTIEKDEEHYHPATKEQRDLLFQKMREAGYEWDAEKKELRKMEQKSDDRLDPLIDEEIDLWIKENSDIHHDNNDIVKLMRDMACYVATLTRNLYRQKSKWSEEDNLMIDSIIDTIKWLEGKGATNMKIDWLTSLKQRMGGEE